MNDRKVDLGFGIVAACVYTGALAVRLASADKGLWLVVGILTGVFTWVVLRYAALRVAARRSGSNQALRVVAILALDLVGVPVSGVVGAVLMRGYSPATTWRVLSEIAGSWWVPLALTSGIAIVGSALMAVFGGRRRRGA